MAPYTPPQPFAFMRLPVSHDFKLVMRAYVNASPRWCNSVSNRIVTIGPLIVLVLLGVTFCIGSRLATRVETSELINPQARSNDLSDINVLPTMEPFTSTPVLQRENTSNVSLNDNFQVVELPKLELAFQTDRASGDSGDTIALSRNRISTSVGSYAEQTHPASRELEPSTTTISPTGLHNIAVDLGDRATGQTTRDVEGSSESVHHEETSHRKPQQSLPSMLETWTGTEANQKQVCTKPAMSVLY